MLSPSLPLARSLGQVPAAAPLDDPKAFMEWLINRTGSQASLARLAGLGTDTVSDYVRGVNEPKLTNTLKMLRAADVRIEGMPDRPDPLEEAIRILRRLEQDLLPGGDDPVQPRESPEAQ